MYDASGSKILAGATVQNNTGQLYVLGNYNNAGTIGNFAFSTGTSGILARNTWVSLIVTFDMVTGRFQAGYSTNGGASYNVFFVDGAAAGTAVAELDLIGSVNSGTAAQGATTGYYDNIQVTSSPAPGALALLGVAGLAGARRRRA
jgi:MYXO-CTERM domain-containing protein